MKRTDLAKLTMKQLIHEIGGYNASSLYDLDQSEFELGGYFDAVARRCGFTSGKQAANDWHLWRSEPLDAIRTMQTAHELGK